jgi:ethanolamine ammonia-lyase small subunit
MDIQKHNGVTEDSWKPLKKFTTARIALGSAGVAIPLIELLQFRLAHAHARDAVYSVIDENRLTEELKTFALPVYSLHTKAGSRNEYLQRPDMGRQLNETSAAQINQAAGHSDIAFILADGLSASAINHHAVAMLNCLLPLLQESGFAVAPICIVSQARVAVGDEIASLLKARLCIVFIGERPGLSSPDSLGVYLTYKPAPGITDEQRNCVSNIHANGLPYASAAEKIYYLVKESFRMQYSGVHLKDNAGLLGG